MVKRIRSLFPSFMTGLLNSYSQVFFSGNKVFALLLLGISFFDPNAGISGVIAVAVSNVTAYLVGLNRASIRSGFYGFNSLLAGLGIGIFYQPGPAYFALLLFTSLLTLMFTVAIEGRLGKSRLPFLSIPFLLSIWLVTLASRQFSMLQISERGLYMMNEMYSLGDMELIRTYNWFNNLDVPEPVRLYFRSLGAIFFQYSMLAGIIVAIGLLIYSRIAFLLSLTGFFAAWFYYLFIGADLHELSAGYIGFNYILTAIAVGGFFIVPSRWSFLWVLLLTPIVSIILTSTSTLFSMFQVSVFSLPFNLVVLLFLYMMRFRERFYDKPEMVVYQQFSPEKNLYATLNYKERAGQKHWSPLDLPFHGTWKVTQAEAGDITHKGDWRHAWDFEVTDEEGSTFHGDGKKPEDYYAFGKPVLAPADGVIEEVVDDVEDNEPGKVNLDQNWGNTLVIRHGQHLYTQVSHLKKGSIKVSRGSTVKKGDLVASCGNSGRSPVPHLHFQVQSTPWIGSKTLDHPLGHYILDSDSGYKLESFTKPRLGQVVGNIAQSDALVHAFHFIAGQKFRLDAQYDDGKTVSQEWEVMADDLNNTCIRCLATGAKAWFRFDGQILWFNHFEGDRGSLLFLFYLGAHKVMTGFYRNLEIDDSYPLSLLSSRLFIFLQDFVAPFYIFMHSDYRLRYSHMEKDLISPAVRLNAMTRVRVFRKLMKKIDFEFFINRNGIETFIASGKKVKTEVHITPL